MTAVPPQLFRRWTHVREEDRPGVRVYRPFEHAIPPARGRDGIAFHPDGTFVEYAPGPADVPTSSVGQWARNGDGSLRLTSAGGRKTTHVQILAVDDRTLQLRPMYEP